MTMDETAELVASLKLVGVDGDGGEHAILVGVATPRRQPTGEWACPTLSYDFQEPRPIYGESSLQALCLGLSFIRLRLEDFLDKGGRLFLEDVRDEVSRQDLAAVFSGVGGAGPG